MNPNQDVKKLNDELQPDCESLQESVSHEPDPLKDRIYRFYMHLFFYFGLVCFLPWIILRARLIDHTTLSDDQMLNFFLFIGFMILTLFVMDNYGVRSMHLDRLSRYLTSGATLLGAFFILALYINMFLFGWNPHDAFQINIVYGTAWVFCFLGWFHIRGDRGINKQDQKPKYRSASLSFFIIFIAFLFGLITLNAIFPFMFLAMVSYPIALFVVKGFKVEVKTRIRNLTKPLKKLRLWDFIIDAFRAIALTTAVLALMFDGKVLYEGDWMKNFITVSLVAAVALQFYDRLKNRMMGLAVVSWCFVFAITQFIISRWFVFEYKIFVLDILNGFTLGGVFFFIEQKAEKSANVRALAGIYYLNIIIIFIFGILARGIPLFNNILESLKLICSLVGIANILGYMRSVNDAKELQGHHSKHHSGDHQA
jgi:hypothetical protein